MCGRTACTLDPDHISKCCRYKKKNGSYTNPDWGLNKDKYSPGYNKAPQSYCPVLVEGKHVDDGNERSLAAMRWGLIPSWFKGDSRDNMNYSMNNARSDTILEKRSYNIPLRKGQRCVVLADGFYEWNNSKIGKQPYYIYFPQQDLQLPDSSEEMPLKLLTMAGIFEKTNCDNEDVFSFTIITVDASADISWLHHRMPALLVGDDEVAAWLDENISLDDALALIKPKNSLQWHPVSSYVNNSRNQGPQCIETVDLDALNDTRKKLAEKNTIRKWLQPKTEFTKKAATSPEKRKSQKKRPATNLDTWLKKTKQE